MDTLSSNRGLSLLNINCNSTSNIEDNDSHSIAVDVLVNRFCQPPYRNQETDSFIYSNPNILSDAYTETMVSSFTNTLSLSKSMANNRLQQTNTSYQSNKSRFFAKSLQQLENEANKTFYSLHSLNVSTNKSKPELNGPFLTNIDINNKSTYSSTNETSMKSHPSEVDYVIFCTRNINSKLFKVKRVKLNEILNYLNDNNKIRNSSTLSNKSTGSNCKTVLSAPLFTSDKVTKKQLIDLLTSRLSGGYSSWLQSIDYPSSNKSTDDSQHLQSKDRLYSESTIETRTTSCLPLKKRKILKSTFETTKQFDQLFKPHSTGDKEGKVIVIYKPEQSQAFSVKDEQLKKQIEIALKQDEDGDLPLHIAVVHKNLAVIESFCKLIQRAGKTVDRFNKKRHTPLHLCVKMNYSNGVRKLIQMGADVNLSDGKGNSAIHVAVFYSHFECFDAILKTCSSPECSKPNLDSHNYEGLTPLHTAVQQHNIKMIRKLLKAGADPDSKDYKSGQSPLFLAVENPNQDIIKLLLENDASVGIQNFAGFTPFLVGHGRKYQEICKLLVDWGADTHGLVFDDLACNYKTSSVKSQLKNKLVANQNNQNNNCTLNENLSD